MDQNTIGKKLRSLRAVVSSVSGVLNNNQDIIISGSPSLKGFARSHYDGQGVSLLRAIGIHIAFIHVESFDPDDPVVQIVSRWNRLPSVKENSWPKVHLINGVVGHDQIEPVIEWLNSIGIKYHETALIGHDLVQFPLMKFSAGRGSFLVAPNQAEKVIKDMAHLITDRPGGDGAFRDFANMVLDMKDVDPTTLPTR